MSARSTGIARARDAAYSEFGRRHFKLIIFMSSVGRAGGTIMAVLVLLAVGFGATFAYNRVHDYRAAHHQAPAVTTAPVTAPEPAAPTAAPTPGPDIDWAALAFGAGTVAIAAAVLGLFALLSPGAYRTAGRKLAALAAALGAGALVYLLKGAV